MRLWTSDKEESWFLRGGKQIRWAVQFPQLTALNELASTERNYWVAGRPYAQQGTAMTSDFIPPCQNLWPFCILFPCLFLHTTKNATIFLPSKACIMMQNGDSDLKAIWPLIPLYFQITHKRNPKMYSHCLGCSSWLPSISTSLLSISDNISASLK